MGCVLRTTILLDRWPVQQCFVAFIDGFMQRTDLNTQLEKRYARSTVYTDREYIYRSELNFFSFENGILTPVLCRCLWSRLVVWKKKWKTVDLKSSHRISTLCCRVRRCFSVCLSFVFGWSRVQYFRLMFFTYLSNLVFTWLQLKSASTLCVWSCKISCDFFKYYTILWA